MVVGSVSLFGCVVGMFVWVCLGLCGLVCVGERGTGVCIERVSVCTFKTFPCVLAACPHVSYMWAWCRYTRGRFECTHGGVLNVHTVFFFPRFFTVPQHTNTNTHTHTKHTPRPPMTPRRQRHHDHTTQHGDRNRERKRMRETRQDKKRGDETRQGGKTREERR